MRTAHRRLLTAAVVSLALALGACGLGSSESQSSDSKTLTVATWKGYGADLSWAKAAFEKETGAKVRYVYIDSEANLVEMLRTQGDEIDVALPNLQYLKPAAEDGLLEPLDTTRLANWSSVYPAFSERDELRVDDTVYGIPWSWGSTGMFYVDSAFPTAPTSYDALWDPANKGKIGLFDDPTVLIPIAAMHLGEDPDNPDMVKVEEALKELKANAKVITTSTDALATALSNKSIVAGISGSSTIGGLAPEIDGLHFLLPEEGGVAFIDNWAISAKSDNVDLAYQWLDYMTSVDFFARWAEKPEDRSPAPANQQATDALSEEATTRIQPQPENIERLTLAVPIADDILQSWLDTWAKVKAS